MEEESVNFEDLELCEYEDVDDDMLVEPKQVDRGIESSEVRNLLAQEVAYSIPDDPVVAETIAIQEKKKRKPKEKAIPGSPKYFLTSKAKK